MLDLTQTYIVTDTLAGNFKKVYHPSLKYGIRYTKIDGHYYISISTVLCNLFGKERSNNLQVRNQVNTRYRAYSVFIDVNNHIYKMDEERPSERKVTACCTYTALFHLFEFVSVSKKKDVVDLDKYNTVCAIMEYAVKYEDELLSEGLKDHKKPYATTVVTRNMAGSKDLKYHNVFKNTDVYLHYVIENKHICYSVASLTKAISGDSSNSNIKLTGIVEIIKRVAKNALYYKKAKTIEVCYVDIIAALPQIVECKFFTDEELETLADIKEQTIKFFKLDADGNVPDSLLPKEQVEIAPVKETPSDDDVLTAKVMAVIKAMKEQGVL